MGFANSNIRIIVAKLFFPFRLKVFGQHRSALFGEDAAGGVDGVVEGGDVEEADVGLDGSAFGAEGAVVDVADTGEQEGAGAHGAGFERDVEVAVFEPPVAQGGGGAAKGEYLGVGRGVGGGVAFVVGRGDDDVVGADQQGTDGDFVASSGEAGLFDGEAHEVFVLLVGAVGHSVPFAALVATRVFHSLIGRMAESSPFAL
jgi:hypothetical protein